MRDVLRAITLTGIFILPFLPLIVADSLFFPFITGKNFLFRIIVEIIFFSWVGLALLDKNYRPKFSWIMGAFLWLIGVMFLADALGVSPHKSFWSNYERMEGFVTLAHLLLYFVVVGSVITTEKLWRAFWNTSMFVAVLMSFYGFAQLGGLVGINQSDFRVDARMGNAAYFAIYLLFHIFMGMFLLVRTPSTKLRVFYAVSAAMFAFMLIQTGTRGAVLALAGGALLSAAYISLFERENMVVRKVAVGMIAFVIVLAGGFYALKDQPFVKENRILGRVASITLKEGATRFTIWKLAIEGIKERPVLGWGQENFNYVFNKYYKAELYGQEPWFDRVHNLMFDWLIAGGIVGFLAYVFLLGSALYYATIRPLYATYAETFSVTERGLIFGLLAGYVAHNLLVFDNVVSLVLFGAVIALIHSRVAKDIPQIVNMKIEDAVMKNVMLPVLVLLCVGTIYMVNVPGLLAASDIIKGFQGNPEINLQAFERALARDGFANQEIREQIARAAQSVAQDSTFSNQMRQLNAKLSAQDIAKRISDLREKYIALAESELEKQVLETPNDARILVFQSSFYRGIGKPAEALPILERAVALSPEKQQILFELGLAQLQLKQMDASKATFKKAFDLAPRNVSARMYYIVAALYSNDDALWKELVTPEYEDAYVMNDEVLRALYDTRKLTELTDVLLKRIVLFPDDLQLRISLAAVQSENGRTNDAIKTVEDAIAKFPTFKDQGEQFLKQLRAGTIPGASTPANATSVKVNKR